MEESTAREVIDVWSCAARRRTLRISNWFSGAVVAAFFGGIGIAALSGALELGEGMLVFGMGMMVAGGTLMLPAWYVTHRGKQLAGPKSPLGGLIDHSSRVTKFAITTRTHRRGVKETVITVHSSTHGQATYPVMSASSGDDGECYGGGSVEQLKAAFNVLVQAQLKG